MMRENTRRSGQVVTEERHCSISTPELQRVGPERRAKGKRRKSGGGKVLSIAFVHVQRIFSASRRRGATVKPNTSDCGATPNRQQADPIPTTHPQPWLTTIIMLEGNAFGGPFGERYALAMPSATRTAPSEPARPGARDGVPSAQTSATMAVAIVVLSDWP